MKDDYLVLIEQIKKFDLKFYKGKDKEINFYERNHGRIRESDAEEITSYYKGNEGEGLLKSVFDRVVLHNFVVEMVTSSYGRSIVDIIIENKQKRRLDQEDKELNEYITQSLDDLLISSNITPTGINADLIQGLYPSLRFAARELWFGGEYVPYVLAKKIQENPPKSYKELKKEIKKMEDVSAQVYFSNNLITKQSLNFFRQKNAFDLITQITRESKEKLLGRCLAFRAMMTSMDTEQKREIFQNLRLPEEIASKMSNKLRPLFEGQFALMYRLAKDKGFSQDEVEKLIDSGRVPEGYIEYVRAYPDNIEKILS